MSITIIRREGSKDRDRRIYQRPNPLNGPIEGIARSVDEAHDIAYHRHGEPHEAFLITGDTPEMRQAHQDNVLKVAAQSGRELDPDRLYRQWQEGEAERTK